MKQFLIQPKYFRVNKSSEATLTIYDYRLPEADPDHTFHVVLNDERLCSCSTKDGFFLRVELPLGTYRVGVQFGKAKKAAIEVKACIDRPGEYGLRLLVAPTFIGFDTLEFDDVLKSCLGS